MTLLIATTAAPSSAVVAALIGGGFSLISGVISILLTHYLHRLDETVRSRRHPPAGDSTGPHLRVSDSSPGSSPPPLPPLT